MIVRRCTFWDTGSGFYRNDGLSFFLLFSYKPRAFCNLQHFSNKRILTLKAMAVNMQRLGTQQFLSTFNVCYFVRFCYISLLMFCDSIAIYSSLAIYSLEVTLSCLVVKFLGLNFIFPMHPSLITLIVHFFSGCWSQVWCLVDKKQKKTGLSNSFVYCISFVFA